MFREGASGSEIFAAIGSVLRAQMTENPFDPPQIAEQPEPRIDQCPACGQPVSRWLLVNRVGYYRCIQCNCKLYLDVPGKLRSFLALIIAASGLAGLRCYSYLSIHSLEWVFLVYIFFLLCLFIPLQARYGIITMKK